MSSAARIVGVFVSPGRTFAEIARAPHVLLCWAVQMVVAFAAVTEMMQRVGLYSLARQSVMQNARTRALDPAALQAAISTTMKVLHVTLYLTPLFVVIGALFLGWIFQGIANFLLGQEARYKQTLSMVSHAYLTQTLLGLLTMLVLALMADPTSYQLVNPIGTNLGFFLDKSATAPFLYALANHIDIFSIWTVFLLAVGLSKLSGRKDKFGSAFSAVGILWLLYVLVSSGFAAAFA